MIRGPFWALQLNVWGSGQVTPDRGTQRISRAARRAIHRWRPATKLPSIEPTTPTLNPLRVDRAPSWRGAGPFDVVL